MSHMKIKNPLDNEISLKYNGDIYILGAKETQEFPEDVVRQWMTIYGFVSVASDDVGVEDKPKKK